MLGSPRAGLYLMYQLHPSISVSRDSELRQKRWDSVTEALLEHAKVRARFPARVVWAGRPMRPMHKKYLQDSPGMFELGVTPIQEFGTVIEFQENLSTFLFLDPTNGFQAPHVYSFDLTQPGSLVENGGWVKHEIYHQVPVVFFHSYSIG